MRAPGRGKMHAAAALVLGLVGLAGATPCGPAWNGCGGAGDPPPTTTTTTTTTTTAPTTSTTTAPTTTTTPTT